MVLVAREQRDTSRHGPDCSYPSASDPQPFELLAPHEADLSGIAAILAKYRGLRIQLADACLVHLANREGIETVFKLDQRDFSVLRLARGKKFQAVP